jgi:HEAT repeat protein
MRKRLVRVFAILTILAIAALVLWRSRRDSEPMYAGKPLKFWLHQYTSLPKSADGSELNAQASEALRSIGTNAIPTLLKMMRESDGWSSNYTLRRLALKCGFLDQLPPLASDLNSEACEGLKLLGDDAKEAVPALVEIFEENISQASQVCAINALEDMGPAGGAALPAFLRATTNSNPTIRCNTLVGLGGLSVPTEAVLPALLNALGDANYSVQVCAIKSLGWRGETAAAAVPALAGMATNTNYVVRSCTLEALGRIHSQLEVTLALLINGLADSRTRMSAIRALERLGEEARPAEAALKKLLGDQDFQVRAAAERALRAIGSSEM